MMLSLNARLLRDAMVQSMCIVRAAMQCSSHVIASCREMQVRLSAWKLRRLERMVRIGPANPQPLSRLRCR